jgi:hypothetical protein
MNEKHGNLSRGFLPGALLGVAALATSCSVDQPKVPCTTAHGTFAVKYTLVPGSGSGECAMLTAGLVGVQSYARKGKDGQEVFDRPPVALKTDEVGGLLETYAPQTADPAKTYSLGEFMTLEPGADNFCPVSALTVAELHLTAVPAGVDPMTMMPTPALPAVDVRYDWSNVRFYVTPAILGTQFSAELTYTRNGCTARYKVSGLYPAISCGKEVTDPGTMMMSMVPDPGLCSPCADPSMGRAAGSGINPDVQTTCDTGSLLCLPSADTPSLAAQTMVCK